MRSSTTDDVATEARIFGTLNSLASSSGGRQEAASGSSRGKQHRRRDPRPGDAVVRSTWRCDAGGRRLVEGTGVRVACVPYSADPPPHVGSSDTLSMLIACAPPNMATAVAGVLAIVAATAPQRQQR
jgi:hypothetical protein